MDRLTFFKVLGLGLITPKLFETLFRKKQEYWNKESMEWYEEQLKRVFPYNDNYPQSYISTIVHKQDKINKIHSMVLNGIRNCNVRFHK